MSSSAGFCSICCRAALCASATSASLPTGGERSLSLSASSCWAHIRLQHQPPHLPQARHTRTGTVLFVAEPCRLWNVSPRLNCFSDLRLLAPGAKHEATSPASNHARAAAHILVVCLIWLRISPRLSMHPLPGVSPPFCLHDRQLHSQRMHPNSSVIKHPTLLNSIQLP